MRFSLSANLVLLGSITMAMSGTLACAELKPGLVGEYFADTDQFASQMKDPRPVLVRVDRQVDFDDAEGPFADTKLAEHFSVRWSGVLRVRAAGAYRIGSSSDDGSQVLLDDKLVTDNSGVHGMNEKLSDITLSAGDHNLVVEFNQGGGQAGCQLLWSPPGSLTVPVPVAALFHDPSSELIPWDHHAYDERKMPTNGDPLGTCRYARMDHGPFISGTFVQPGKVCTNKGITLRFGPNRAALAVFDPELMRFSYAANDGVVHFPPGRDGIEGQPGVEGIEICSASSSAGWARPGTGDFTDPRPDHLGNLPKGWAFYHGLYLHDDQVVLSYSVGNAQVLEMVGLEPCQGGDAMSRSLTLNGNDTALRLLVAELATGTTGARIENGLGLLDDGDAIVAAGVIGAGTLIADGARLTLQIPVNCGLIKLLIWRGEKSALPAFQALLAASPKAVDAHAFITGGKRRWGDALQVPGQVGTDVGPYVVDTITVPYDNPSKSYMRLSGHDFFSDGRAAVCTLDGDVWIVTGIDATLSTVTWKRFASGLFQPLGLRIVDDRIYVVCRDRLMRLTDLNGDGEADYYESFNSDCPVSKFYHEFALDLETDKDGNFYYNKGSNLGESNDAFQGCTLKVSKDGSTLTKYCTGLREPNGMGGGDGYPLLVSDNQGNWIPVDRIDLIKPGGFYGFMGTAHRTPLPTTYDLPLMWTPYDLDNSPGGLAYVDNDQWGPYRDKPIGLSYGRSCIFAVLPEEVEGVAQAGLTFFPLHFASGIMRARFNPHDHALYVTGLRGWTTNGVHEGAFQRVRYTGKPVYMLTDLHVHKDALVISFAQKLDPAFAADVENYAIDQWNYRWTANYGSKDYKVSDAQAEGHDPVKIAAAELSADGKTVTLRIPGLAPVMQMRTKYHIAAADGTEMKGELYQTINKVPSK